MCLSYTYCPTFCLEAPRKFANNLILENFYVLLTVHLGSIFVNNQFDAQVFFRVCLFHFSTCFEHPCAHHQENQLC